MSPGLIGAAVSGLIGGAIVGALITCLVLDIRDGAMRWKGGTPWKR